MAVSSPINSSSFSLGSFFSFLSSSSAKKQAQIQNEQLSRLTSIRKNLEKIFKVYEGQYNAIIAAERKTRQKQERQKGLNEESLAEKKVEKDVLKDKIISKAKDIFGGLLSFFENIIKYIILYKVLDWFADPKNKEKVGKIFKFFAGVVKFFASIIGFGVDRIFDGLDKLINGSGVTRFFGLLEGILGVFTILPFIGGMSIVVNAIKMIPRLFSGLTKFFTNLLPNVLGQGAKEALDDGAKAAKSAAKDAGQEATKATAKTTEKAATTATTKGAEGAAKGITKSVGEGVTKGAVKGGAKIGMKGIAKAIPVVGAVAGAAFAVDRASKGDWLGAGGELLSGAASLIPGWGTVASLGIDAALIGRDIAGENQKDEKLPKLAAGGVVTKPTKAIVGESGPEAIIPLSKLGSSSIGVDNKELTSTVGRIIPAFMKLLLLPFTVIGAGVMSLIGGIASKFPIIGPLIGGTMSMIASAFGIPKSLVNIALKGLGKVDLSNLGGMSDLASLFGKAPNIKEKKKGDKKDSKDGFKKSNDDSVRGLLGDILNALIYKNVSGEDSGSPAPSPDTPASGGGGGGENPTGAQMVGGAAVKSEDFAKTQLKNTKPKFGGKSESMVMEVGNKNLQKVTGQNPGKYYYDAYGTVYAVDKDEKRTLTKEELKSGVQGSAGGIFGNLQFFRNLNNGVVSISSPNDAKEQGWYDYAANSVRELVKGKGGKNDPDKINWVHVNDSAKYKSAFSEETPYGKTTLKALNGRRIPGHGSGDKVHVLAEPGEYMMNKNFVKAVGGAEVLDKYNYGMFPRFGTGMMGMATGGSVIEYITGDKSSPNYSTDHGGGNYHDHLAFTSKAERDKAIKYLQGKGWSVGSKNDGKHATNSWHYKDRAFDIPFYPNDKIKGVSDDAKGETKLSSALRKDLLAGGFSVPGASSSGQYADSEKDGGTNTPASKDTDTDMWANFAKNLTDLSTALGATPPRTETASGTTVTATAPSSGTTKPLSTTSPSPNNAGTRLNTAQSKANTAARTQSNGTTATTVINTPSVNSTSATTSMGGSSFSTIHTSASPYITYPLHNT